MHKMDFGGVSRGGSNGHGTVRKNHIINYPIEYNQFLAKEEYCLEDQLQNFDSF